MVESTCSEIVELGKDRRSWLVFCVTVEHAQHVCEALQRHGVVAELVTGEAAAAERDSLLKRFKSGEIPCLRNVAVLATGFNAPGIDFIANLRATMSPVLLVQINGRGMRLLPETGKSDCIVADFTDTALRLGPVDVIKGKAPCAPGGKTPPDKKICDACGHQCHPSLRACLAYGTAFPEPERLGHASTATGAPMLSSQEPSHFTYQIDKVTYMRHPKPFMPVSMRVQ